MSLLPQSPGGRDCLRVFFLSFGLFMLLCVPPPGPTQCIFHTPMARYSLFVLKALLNTNKPSQTIVRRHDLGRVADVTSALRLWASCSHPCASVAKQYNLVPATRR